MGAVAGISRHVQTPPCRCPSLQAIGKFGVRSGHTGCRGANQNRSCSTGPENRRITAITGNKGEWSEIYAFLRLLADGKLFAADAHSNRIDLHYPIVKIIRKETAGTSYEYRPVDSEIVICANDREMPARDFCMEASRLFADITNQTNKSAFEVARTEAFIRSIHVNKLKAPSDDKSDIHIQVHDIHTGYEPLAGFSIKSELGRPPTLLNASQATNFIYKVDGVDSRYGAGAKGKDLVKAIYNAGGRLVFQRTQNSIFNDNLIMIDSRMPAIIAEMLVGYYTEKAFTCAELAEYVGSSNILGQSADFYKHKTKEMLSAVALGMKPATPWNGTEEASGGYIIVKANGDVAAYHLYNRDAFRWYLPNNTRFKTPSTGRHDFCKLYEEAGATFIKLNLQIRFSG
jgi:type II restriction enzyme